MSSMYGPRRVVLKQEWPRLVCVCGSDGHGGNYHPLGYWYKDGGLFYVDLKSYGQWYDSVNKETIAHKRLGATQTKDALRKFVMSYYLKQREVK